VERNIQIKIDQRRYVSSEWSKKKKKCWLSYDMLVRKIRQSGHLKVETIHRSSVQFWKLPWANPYFWCELREQHRIEVPCFEVLRTRQTLNYSVKFEKPKSRSQQLDLEIKQGT